MKGRRLPDYTDWHSGMQPGEYAKLNDQGYWVAVAPDGTVGCFDSNKWTVTIHEDQTITVSPSLWFNYPSGWHGFLELGMWRT